MDVILLIMIIYSGIIHNHHNFFSFLKFELFYENFYLLFKNKGVI
ncbi:hypothetical protein BWGOE8_17970 [Bacillus mycoides]|uniref:Uncharacterized protein n=1 Tax=Bacillus mycoides TaxID=1405 RepID=A0A1E8B9J9_BACMY|nr:hypothetical protein BWGOE8_17970 [Bacillus mycoides]OFD81566.1 hypothetical protein BWGOE9_17660 [Bacillus mycoides]OFD83857.1 hypothetical protein BWGOE10_17850 [Bacillus mycoides]